MKLKNLMYSGLILVALALFGCGGGGGGSDDTVVTTTLSKKLITSGSLPPDRKIFGIQAEIILPSGVTVKSDSDNKVLASSLQLSGVATNSSFIWGSINGNKLTIGMATPEVSQGNDVGEFATIYFDVASTAPVPLGDFSINPGYIISGYDSLAGDQPRLHEAPYNLKMTLQ